MGFITKIDYSNNRQIKQDERTFTILSGGTIFGLSYSAMTKGPDTNNILNSNTVYTGTSTFSGNQTTTIFNWYDPLMNVANTSITAITETTSGETQIIDTIWGAYTYNTTQDGYTYVETYTGITFDLEVTTIASGNGPTYSGEVIHNYITYFTAGTLDYTGRTIWIDNPEITRTKRLIINNNPQIGYILTCINSEGEVQFQPPGASSFSGNTSATCISDIWVTNLHSCSPMYINPNDEGDIYIGNNAFSFKPQTKTLISNYDSVLSSQSSIIDNGNSITNNAIIGGYNNKIINGVNNTVILGGSNITGNTSDITYVPDLIIDGLVNASGLATDANGKIVETASDIRLKKNINNIDEALNKILSLRPVSFEWVDEFKIKNGKAFGLIAQEVEKIIPEIVRERAKSDGTLTIDYIELIPFIIKAIQELSINKINGIEREIQIEKIICEDNIIELNYNGNYETSKLSGIVIKNGLINEDVYLGLNEDNQWVTNTKLKPESIILKNYTPTSSDDKYGDIGEMTYDNNYMYIKTEDGWKRAKLEKF